MLHWRKRKPDHKRAIGWFKTHMVSGEGIIVHTGLRVHYTELTDYSLPTSYIRGKTYLAHTCTKWLLSIQQPGDEKHTSKSEISWKMKYFLESCRLKPEREGKHA